MKRLLPASILILFFLAACAPSVPSTLSADVILTSVAQTLTAYPTQTPAVVTPIPSEGVPTTSLPTDTLPAPTATTAPPPPPVYVYIYPTPVVYPTPIIYPTPIALWSPAYADQFIYYYYQKINARDYTTTWSLLTNAFKAAVNPDGYSGYVAYWNSVSRVDINSVTVTSLASPFATVVVNMVYNYVAGYAVNSTQTFHLYYDTWRATWMFDSAAGTVPTSVPTAIPPVAYPADFIYYYFNNINARNYPLTWSLLDAYFISRNNPDGYTGYVNYWNSVSNVTVTYVTVNSYTSSYASVSVGLVFTYVSSLVTSANVTYQLIYNTSLGSWQFH
jgi:hypothetical protein